MHILLHDIFNNSLSGLFDVIEENFRDISLVKKIMHNNCTTHKDYIKKESFEKWCCITHNSIDEAKHVCSIREEKNTDWVEVFGMFYLYHFIDEQHDRVLRMNKSLFVQWEYLEEL